MATDPGTDAFRPTAIHPFRGDSGPCPGPERADTHGVILSDVTANVQHQLVADVDGEVDGSGAAGRVTASHQAGLQPRCLKHR